MRAHWTTDELRLAAAGWHSGMCARCVSRLLKLHGYDRTHRAVQSLPGRYPHIKRKARGGYQA